jgi:hypothetical protein
VHTAAVQSEFAKQRMMVLVERLGPVVQSEFAKQRMMVLVERLGPVALWQECYLLLVKNGDIF